MEKRTCKKTGLELSVLGLGCWAFGGNEDDYWGEQSQREVDRIVEEAINLGITYFDTAEAYNNGRSEESLGRAVKGFDREKIVIGSKILPNHLYADQVAKHCEASLKRLQTEYLDLYMIHWPINEHSLRSFTKDQSVVDRPPTLEKAIAALQDLRERGLIRHIGISNFGPQQLGEVYALEPNIAANQLIYNLFSRAIEHRVIPISREHGTGIIAYMPLQQAMLTGRYDNISELPELRRRTIHFHRDSTPLSRHGGEGAEAEINAALTEIKRISADLGISVSQLALKWCTVNPAITTTIVGTRKVSQLRDSVAALKVHLSPAVMQELDRLTLPILEKLGYGIDYFQGKEAQRGF
jgi:aryl-alcohol dehydrogenase-like predicted oxidoreductase